MFRRLLSKKFISPEKCRYSSYNFKKASTLEKLYFLPKNTQKTGRHVSSDCDTPAEETSEQLDYHLKPIMRSALSYVRDISDFLKKHKEFGSVPQNVLVVTADIVGLYPSIPRVYEQGGDKGFRKGTLKIMGLLQIY